MNRLIELGLIILRVKIRRAKITWTEMSISIQWSVHENITRKTYVDEFVQRSPVGSVVGGDVDDVGLSVNILPSLRQESSATLLSNINTMSTFVFFCV